MTVAASPGPALAPTPGMLPPGHYGPVGQLRSEWIKLRTVRSTMWSLVATIVAVVGIGAIASAVTAAHWRNSGFVERVTFDPTSRSLAGIFLGQIVIGVLGVLVMSAEYGTGTIRATLSAIPNRPLVLACKAATFGFVAFVASEVLTFAAFLLGQVLLHGSAPSATLGQPGVFRVVFGAGLVLTVLGLFALGLATILRHTAGALAAYVGLLLVLPLILQAFPTSWQNAAMRYMPLVIGERMTATVVGGDHAFNNFPLFSPWAGFGLLCAYAAAALLVGGFVLVRRDA